MRSRINYIVLAITFVLIILVIFSKLNKDKFLSDSEALLLLVRAADTTRYVSEGGNNPIINQNDLSAMKIEDVDINTKQKVMTYLQKIYTKDVAEQIYNMCGYNEINGILYKDISDLVYTKEWNDAVVKDIKYTGNRALVTFQVPSDFDNTSTINIEFIKNDVNEIRVNNMVY
ncbi:DL-endopeptidase inhibitor IseA family protein [Brassicibacter mesophilus]|uniref:DL-endopeptidase inhibitor IseA family protein n=1 Tax=Brassicibacter mesophilus TaxID=745119 RepID=UPI003D251790